MATLYHNREIFVWFFIKNSQIFFPKIPIFFRFGHLRCFCVDSGNVLCRFLLYLYIISSLKIVNSNTLINKSMRKKEPIWRVFAPSALFFCLFLFKSVHKAGNVCRTDISAYHSISINQHICPNRTLVSFIIFDGKGVARNVLAAILGQVEPLRLLQLIVSGKNLIEFRRNCDRLFLYGCPKTKWTESELR